MKKIYFNLSLLPLLMASLSAQAALDGREIMAKNEEALKLTDFTAKAKLTTQKAGQAEKSKVFSIWRKLKSDRVRYQTLTQFHEPAEVKNEAILFLENDQGENDIFLYLPAYKKVRRVERSQQSGSFMGSDFSYTDITTPHATDYKQKLLKEEPCPSGDGKGKPCYVVEAVPLNDSIRERTGYSKITSWVRKENFMIAKSDYLDLSGKPVKEILFSQAKPVGNKGKWMSHHVEVKGVKNQGRTVLAFENVKADAGIEDSKFTQQNLSKLK